MERPSEVRAESDDGMSTEKSTGKRDHLRVVKNPKESSGDSISWKLVAVSAGVSAAVSYAVVELIKLGVGKAKKAANIGQEKRPNPQPQLPGMVMPPGMDPEQQQALFQSPYAQMAMMRGGFVPPSPTFPNPLVAEEEDDAPPKWFRRFKEEHDKELSELKRAMQGPSASDFDDFEEED